MIPRIQKKIFGLELEMHPVVFPTTAGLLLLFVALTAYAPRRALWLFNSLQTVITSHFSWLYVMSMTGFLLFALWLCFSPFGNIRLGKDEDRPEFPTVTWFAMLFSAGMGIGLLFFGVVEPMNHFLSPLSGEPQSLQAARNAMGITIFHWGLHPWSLYAVVALALAYFGFRKGLPLSFRSMFHPLLGDRIFGRIGDMIDIVAVCATLFGLATSLGLGAKQVNAGLHYVFGLPQNTKVQVALIACITGMAVISLISGLDAGIRRLSETNMFLAGFLLIFLFICGPTVYLLGAVSDNMGAYLQRVPTNSFWTATYDSGARSSWFSSWTVFYWAWWIAWSPFVGMFIARVSKGRTVKEFITAVLVVPMFVNVIWMTGFGNTAIHQEIYKQVSIEPEKVAQEFNYAPTEYDVQVTDEKTGFPLTEDGRWLLAPDAKGVANPHWVLIEERAGQLVTKDGTAVSFEQGVMVEKESREIFDPPKESLYQGRFQSRAEELTLGGYISSPVLTEDHRSTVDTTSTAMFVMLKAYPLSTLTALIGTISIILFFVTSSDSASLVADIIASGGNQDPPVGTRLFWGITEGLLASVLLTAGGLVALQTGTIAVGLPLNILVILGCVGLYRGLEAERKAAIKKEPAESADSEEG